MRPLGSIVDPVPDSAETWLQSSLLLLSQIQISLTSIALESYNKGWSMLGLRLTCLFYSGGWGRVIVVWCVARHLNCTKTIALHEQCSRWSCCKINWWYRRPYSHRGGRNLLKPKPAFHALVKPLQRTSGSELVVSREVPRWLIPSPLMTLSDW